MSVDPVLKVEEVKEEIAEVKAEPATPARDAELKALSDKLDLWMARMDERVTKVEASPLAPAPAPEPVKEPEPVVEEKPEPEPTSHDLWGRRKR